MPLADYDGIRIGSVTVILRLPSRAGSTLTVPER
jgi:hypothetical protein